MNNALITDEQRIVLLANGRESLENPDFDPAPVVKLFTPDAGATWLLTEIDPDDHDHAFGLCDLGLLIRRELFMRPHRRHACRQSTSGPALACSPTSSCVLSPPRAAWPWFAPEPCCQSHASNRH